VRRSFIRLIIGSVLACWAIGFLVLFSYARSQSWTEEKARRDGVFLVFQLLDHEPASNRARRLSELEPHSSVGLNLLTPDEAARRVGRPLGPGDQIPHKVSPQEHWYILVFQDGLSALAAGPVNPASPSGARPIGIVLAIVGLPLIAGLIAMRVEQQLRKVEHASQALAVGDLGARVEVQSGQPNELAANFNAMAERIEHLIRSRDELVQAVSHELGSPLSRLRFHIELLEHQSEEKRDDRIRAMSRELGALDELVAELLSYVQSDELELERVEFDPIRGLADLTELARLETTGERTIDVDCVLPDRVSVFADQRLFLRAIENLLRNAVRHAGNRVQLVLTDDEDYIRVSVHDDGPGIPEALREKAMTPFVRVEADRGRKSGGVGLGLAIVSRIMDRHGGRLEIGDSPLGGAKVATLWPKRN
jgi:signal transduction histidine kinase